MPGENFTRIAEDFSYRTDLARLELLGLLPGQGRTMAFFGLIFQVLFKSA